MLLSSGMLVNQLILGSISNHPEEEEREKTCWTNKKPILGTKVEEAAVYLEQQCIDTFPLI